MKWNPYVLGLCDSLTVGQYICITSPGTNGTFTLPDPPLGTDAGDANQQRGGAGGIVTPTTTVTATGDPISGGLAPSPTQDGLVSNCNNFASAQAGQGCYDFATSHSIQPTQLYAWNPALGLDGAGCATALWASEYYCIGTWVETSTGHHRTGPNPDRHSVRLQQVRRCHQGRYLQRVCLAQYDYRSPAVRVEQRVGNNRPELRQLAVGQ